MLASYCRTHLGWQLHKSCACVDVCLLHGVSHHDIPHKEHKLPDGLWRVIESRPAASAAILVVCGVRSGRIKDALVGRHVRDPNELQLIQQIPGRCVDRRAGDTPFMVSLEGHGGLRLTGVGRPQTMRLITNDSPPPDLVTWRAVVYPSPFCPKRVVRRQCCVCSDNDSVLCQDGRVTCPALSMIRVYQSRVDELAFGFINPLTDQGNMTLYDRADVSPRSQKEGGGCWK